MLKRHTVLPNCHFTHEHFCFGRYSITRSPLSIFVVE